MSTKRHRADWLSLVEVSRPFLAMPVPERVFPHGLDAHDPEHFRSLRVAHNEWSESQEGWRPNPAIHKAWGDLVMRQPLGLPDEVLAEGQAIAQTLKAVISEHGETLRPKIRVRKRSGTPAQPRDCPSYGAKITPGSTIKVESHAKERRRTVTYCGDVLGPCPFSVNMELGLLVTGGPLRGQVESQVHPLIGKR